MTATAVIRSSMEINGDTIVDRIEITAGMATRIAETIPESSTELEFALAFAVAKLKAIKLTSDQALTIKTNDQYSPDDTIELEADKPLDWNEDSGLACPFTEDVTVVYITEAGAGDAALQGWVLVDPT